MLSLILALAAPVPPPMPAIVSGSVSRENDRRILVAAFRAPQRRRVAGRPHYCIDDYLTRADEARRVCRSRRDWQRYGIDPVISAGR